MSRKHKILATCNAEDTAAQQRRTHTAAQQQLDKEVASLTAEVDNWELQLIKSGVTCMTVPLGCFLLCSTMPMCLCKPGDMLFRAMVEQSLQQTVDCVL